MSFHNIIRLLVKELESEELIELRKADIQSFLAKSAGIIYELTSRKDEESELQLRIHVKALNIICKEFEKVLLHRMFKVLKYGNKIPKESLDHNILAFFKKLVNFYINIPFIASVSDLGNRVLVQILKPFKIGNLHYVQYSVALLKLDLAIILHVLGFVRVIEAKIFKQAIESFSEKTGDRL